MYAVDGAARGTYRSAKRKLKVRDMWDLERIKVGGAEKTSVEQEEENIPFSTTSAMENNEFC
jgi:hypothetical protein